MSYYKDLREHLVALENNGKLVRIKREINKDTEIHPLVRLQFRGLPEEERKAFFFENVVDAKGHKYDGPVVVGALAASLDIYAIGLMCKPEEINEGWRQAQLNPIEPRIIDDGAVHEEIHIGDNLLEHGGLDEFPITISTPGYDPGPFFSAPYWVTKDPDSKVINIGTYRAHVKSPTRTGIMVGTRAQHIAIHLRKCHERAIPLEAAIVVGATPNIGYVSTTTLPYEVNEYAYAGGLAGEPVELVKCKTVDLEVPATAEIVVEGELSTIELEPEAPFGEYTGYMGLRGINSYFTVKCITHRKKPIWQAFISQFPPNESSKIKQVGIEGTFYKHVRDDLGISEITEVVSHESCGGQAMFVIKFKKASQSDIWLALESLSSFWGTRARAGRLFVAVDDDISARDADAVNWAIFTRAQPHRDMRIKRYPIGSLVDYSISDPNKTIRRGVHYVSQPESSHLLINATMKWPYPPIALPKREFMERAVEIWNEEGLPPLRLKEPWWGENLGCWTKEDEEFANLATQGEYCQIGDILAKRRQRLD